METGQQKHEPKRSTERCASATIVAQSGPFGLIPLIHILKSIAVSHRYNNMSAFHSAASGAFRIAYTAVIGSPTVRGHTRARSDGSNFSCFCANQAITKPKSSGAVIVGRLGVETPSQPSRHQLSKHHAGSLSA
jgi:hypothetical protein